MSSPELELSERWRGSLRSAVSRLDRRRPIIVVAISDNYVLFLDNWLCHMEALGVDNILVVAMDEPLATRLAGVGIATAQCDFDGSWSHFWYRRFLVWDFLIAEGLDIIHSDVDAIWLRDPIERYFFNDEIDLIWSQGTLHPKEVWSQWGFVLCTGLFVARASAGTKRFFAITKSRADEMLKTTDQAVMNQVLCEHGVTWAVGSAEGYHLDWNGTPYSCFDEMIAGNCQMLGLRMGLLPYRLFPRSVLPGQDGAFVKHLHPPQGGDHRQPEGRVAQMRAQGCWMLDRKAGKITGGAVRPIKNG